jgi:hypothetical protein
MSLHRSVLVLAACGTACSGKPDETCPPVDTGDSGTEIVTDTGPAETVLDYQIETKALDTVDVSLVVSAWHNMEWPIDELTAVFGDAVAATSLLYGSSTFGLATYVNYATYYTQPPFRLEIQQADDVDAVQGALEGIVLDGEETALRAKPIDDNSTVESTMEALYQTLTGGGYDQECDGTFDVDYRTADVLPLHATASDPFGGSAGDTYDPLVPGTGPDGGLGFRSDARLRVIFTFGAFYLRDADDDRFAVPGGCPLDAGMSDVVGALPPRTYIVGMSFYPYLGTTQMEALAEASGSMADLDGDKKPDPLVFESTDVWKPEAEMLDDMVTALEAIKSIAPPVGVVTLEVRDDPHGLVELVSPTEHTNVDPSQVESVSFSVKYDLTAIPLETDATVTLMVVADGVDVYPITETLEAPGE